MPHAESKVGWWDGTEWNVCILLYLPGNMVYFCVLVTFFFSFGGAPHKSPVWVCIQTRGQTSGLHMNLRLPWVTHTHTEKKIQLPEWASANVHSPSKHFCAAAIHHISHTALFSTPPALYDFQTSPPSPLVHLRSAACTTHSHGYIPMRFFTAVVQYLLFVERFFSFPSQTHGMSKDFPCLLFLVRRCFILLNKVF